MAGGPLAATLATYEARESQLAMADAVESTLDDGGVLFVEAGTGTGKTLAYLVPALLSDRRVVISTGTKALQDQLMSHDVPLVSRLLGLEDGEVVCLKGLSNYLCLRRYEEHRQSPEALGLGSAKRLPLLEKWRETTSSGDRAELDFLAEDDPLWAHVASGSDTRIGPKCTHYEDCFVTNARRRAEAARVVIVNHHLFFADLATRHPGGGILPSYDAVIFDEAHQIEDVATEFFGARVSTTRLETLVRDARASFGAARLLDESHPHTSAILDHGAQFFSRVPRTAAAEARLSLSPRELSTALLADYHQLDGALEGLEALARLSVSKSDALAQVARRAREVRNDLAAILDGDGADHVTWSESRGRRVSIGKSPIDVRKIVRDEVLDRTPAVVFTSATLSTGGSFSFVKHRFGVESEHEARELSVPSPFDYAKQAALYLPTLPDPRAPEYFDAAADEALSLLELTGGGAFVLCTSHRAVGELRKRIEPRTTLRVLSQGTAPKAALLEDFRKDGHAVLFATSSFWEGIDVPGEALRLVIVDKLPFDVPSDPIVVARCKRIEEAGDSPFMKLLVPSAAIALKQGFGRLIRRRTDHGVVAIFDARITTKSYGRVFLKSLPEATRCRTIDEVRAFYAPPHASPPRVAHPEA